MECRLHQIVRVSDKPGGGILVLGEILRFHVLESLLDGYKIDPDRLDAIGRMGGPTTREPGPLRDAAAEITTQPVQGSENPAAATTSSPS